MRCREGRTRARSADFLADASGRAYHRPTVPHPRLDSPSRRCHPRSAPERPRILLLCPEALGPQACCVEDALRARGYPVELALGRHARRWVRTVPPGPTTIRVLCVPTIDPAYAQRLCQGRPDFHIVGWKTPLHVVQEIERIVGRLPSDRRPRPSRIILAQPTLIEQSLHAEHRWSRGVLRATAAVALVAIGGLLGAWASGGASTGGASAGGTPTGAAPDRAHVVQAAPDSSAAPSVRSRRARSDEPVLSAVAVDPSVLGEPDEEGAAASADEADNFDSR